MLQETTVLYTMPRTINGRMQNKMGEIVQKSKNGLQLLLEWWQYVLLGACTQLSMCLSPQTRLQCPDTLRPPWWISWLCPRLVQAWVVGGGGTSLPYRAPWNHCHELYTDQTLMGHSQPGGGSIHRWVITCILHVHNYMCMHTLQSFEIMVLC